VIRSPSAAGLRRAVLAAVLLGSLAALVGGPASGAAGVSATEQLARSTQAATRAGSVHFVQVVTQGSNTTTLVGDLSAPSADETASLGSARLEVRLVGGVIYVLANQANLLVNALGLSNASATANVGHWVSVQPADAPFSALSHALDLTVELDSFVPGNPGLTERSPVKVQGSHAVRVTGTPSADVRNGAKGTSTFLVNVRSPHLPVGATMVLTEGTVKQTRLVAFTKWGQPVDLAAPAAVALASLP
jgi:hypothetical protein